MKISDIIKSFRAKPVEEIITWKVDPREGIDFIMDRKVFLDPASYSSDNALFGMQLAYLRSLFEQGAAAKNANGFTVESKVVVDLDDTFQYLFKFPNEYKGRFVAKIKGSTTRSDFGLKLELLLPDGDSVPRYELFGPFLKLSENELYRLTPACWAALKAVEDFQALSPDSRGEYENNKLILLLQQAVKAGVDIDLAHFNKLEVVGPDRVGVAVEEMANGDLSLTPSYGNGIAIDDIKNCLGQLTGDNCVLRVKNDFVLLDEVRLKATKEILTNRRIPKEQVNAFFRAPTAYLDGALVDLDTGFSVRVHGAEKFSHRYFGDVEQSGVDWFERIKGDVEPAAVIASVVDTEEKLVEVETLLTDAKQTGAQTIELDDHVVDVSDEEEVQAALESVRERLTERPQLDDKSDTVFDDNVTTERAVVSIDTNDENLDFSAESLVEQVSETEQSFERSNLKRAPFEHQEQGIQWMLAHFVEAAKRSQSSGALLADDMGLGKTYMTLVAIAEWYNRAKQLGNPEKPTLIIAPLGLIENWQAEVDDTFKKSPFKDIVVLQAGADLKQFRCEGTGRETQQDFAGEDVIAEQDQIRYSLKIGGVFGSERLDLPRRLVLTTYETLRDYQFSLSRIDWGVVAFDEAQKLKNPNALWTRAAKALKADFKLLASGTPVENSLKDFWCLMDTAVPGLMGAWQTFRKEFIAPIQEVKGDASEIRLEVGKKLRAKVGDYMLRRTKAEKLSGLPSKRVFSGDADSTIDTYEPTLAAVMSGEQLAYYDSVIETVNSCKPEEKRGVVLPSLRRLKVASIHHDLAEKRLLAGSSKQLQQQALCSVKIQSMLSVIKQIKAREEKVLIFAETKAVQVYVSTLVSGIYNVSVEIINGDTKAVPSKHCSETRKSKLDDFQKQPGFGAIVMSPVAAGVGLTVVGANNVIHLERHWNPAKEAQATDRVYRIGQTKEVNVYLPMALHPKVRSFDLQLNGLLANKVDLSQAVVTNQAVAQTDLQGCF